MSMHRAQAINRRHLGRELSYLRRDLGCLNNRSQNVTKERYSSYSKRMNLDVRIHLSAWASPNPPPKTVLSTVNLVI